jgi:hypothetical protein
MKSTLRSRLAAAALLVLPMGAMLAAQPAAAQYRVYGAERGAGYQNRSNEGDRVNNQRFGRNFGAPRVLDVYPASGDFVSEREVVQVAVRFAGGVTPDTVVLRIDGRNVTGVSRFEGNVVRFREGMQPGPHDAEVIVRDGAGNENRHAWRFDVAAYDTKHGYSYSTTPPRW